MIDEFLAAIAGYISGQSAEKPKRTKALASISIGLLFFIVNFTIDFIEGDIQADNILVLISLSIFLVIFCYFILLLHLSRYKK